MSNERARWFFGMVVEMRKRQRMQQRIYQNTLELDNEYERIVDAEIERVEQLLDRESKLKT